MSARMAAPWVRERLPAWPWRGSLIRPATLIITTTPPTCSRANWSMSSSNRAAKPIFVNTHRGIRLNSPIVGFGSITKTWPDSTASTSDQTCSASLTSSCKPQTEQCDTPTTHEAGLPWSDTPAQLATVAKPDQFSGPPSGVIASCFSVLRTSHPTRYQRLIPGGEPSPFVAGLERELATPAAWITQRVQTNSESTNMSPLTWPEMVWWENLPTAAGHRWTFGQVSPLRNGSPAKIEAVPLNWNTAAFLYRFEIP